MTIQQLITAGQALTTIGTAYFEWLTDNMKYAKTNNDNFLFVLCDQYFHIGPTDTTFLDSKNKILGYLSALL